MRVLSVINHQKPEEKSSSNIVPLPILKGNDIEPKIRLLSKEEQAELAAESLGLNLDDLNEKFGLAYTGYTDDADSGTHKQEYAARALFMCDLKDSQYNKRVNKNKSPSPSHYSYSELYGPVANDYWYYLATVAMDKYLTKQVNDFLKVVGAKVTRFQASRLKKLVEAESNERHPSMKILPGTAISKTGVAFTEGGGARAYIPLVNGRLYSFFNELANFLSHTTIEGMDTISPFVNFNSALFNANLFSASTLEPITNGDHSILDILTPNWESASEGIQNVMQSSGLQGAGMEQYESILRSTERSLLLNHIMSNYIYKGSSAKKAVLDIDMPEYGSAEEKIAREITVNLWSSKLKKEDVPPEIVYEATNTKPEERYPSPPYALSDGTFRNMYYSFAGKFEFVLENTGSPQPRIISNLTDGTEEPTAESLQAIQERFNEIPDMFRKSQMESRISARVAVDIPKSIVQYATQSDNPNASDLSKWLDNVVRMTSYKMILPSHIDGIGPNISSTSNNEKNPRVSSVSPEISVSESLDKAKSAFKAYKPTNNNNLATSRTGEIFWVPDMFDSNVVDSFQERIDGYNELTIGGEDRYDPALGRVLRSSGTESLGQEKSRSISDPIRKELFKLLSVGVDVENVDTNVAPVTKGSLVCTDWCTGRVYYYDSSSNLTYTDVSSWKPTEAIHLQSYFQNRPLIRNETDRSTSILGSLGILFEELGLTGTIGDFAHMEDFAADFEGGLQFNNFGQLAEAWADPTTAGDSVYTDLTASQAAQHLANYASQPVTGNNLKNFALGVLNRLANGSRSKREGMTVSGIYGDEAASLLDQDFNADNVTAQVSQNNPEWKITSINGVATSKTRHFSFLMRISQAIVDAINTNPVDKFNLLGSKAMHMVPYAFIYTYNTEGSYTSNFTALSDDADRDGFNLLDEPKREDWHDYESTPIPNIAPPQQWKPHQLTGREVMDKRPRKFTLAVQAGGGKTYLSIGEILLACQEGQKVLVIVPGKLMGVHYADVSKFTNGQLNIIPIDTHLFNEKGPEGIWNDIKNMPVNSMVLANMEVFKGVVGGRRLKFPKDEIKVSMPLEVLKRIDWDLIIIDESHKLKNTTSKLNVNIGILCARAKRVGLMTGTFIPKDCLDAYGQTLLLDYGIFYGSKDRFFGKYARVRYGSRDSEGVLGGTEWNDDAEVDIRRQLESKTAYIDSKRVEWAASLPNVKHQFHLLNLTDNQRAIYEQIFEDFKYEEESKIKGKKTRIRDADDEDENLDDYNDDSVGEVSKNDFIALEQFLCSPILSEEGDRLLKGEDRKSVKLQTIIDLLEEHFADPNNLKVMIFTSWKLSASFIYENLPEKFKKMTLRYMADDSDVHIPAMQDDDNIQIVIGVEDSIREGHNLPMFNRLIRVEAPWTPGDLEQANSRLNRLSDLSADERPTIYIDWLTVDGTVDVTKTCRVVGAECHTAKFEHATDSRYEGLPMIPKLPMNLDIIEQYSWLNSPFPGVIGNMPDGSTMNLIDVFSIHEQINQFFEDDANAKRDEYIRQGIDNEKLVIKSGGTIPGSKYLKGRSYVPFMQLPFEEDIGIVNMGVHARSIGVRDLTQLRDEVMGERVHTDRGDGIITKATNDDFTVKLDSGDRYKVRKTCVFLLYEKARKLRKPIADVIADKINLPIVDALTLEGEAVDTTTDELDTTDIEALEELEGTEEDDEIKTEDSDIDEQPIEDQLDDEEDSPNDSPPIPKNSTTQLLRDGNTPEDFGQKRLHLELLVVNNIPTVAFSYDGAAPGDLEAATTYGMKDSGPLWYVRCDTYKKYMSAWNALTKAESSGIIEMKNEFWDELDQVGLLYEKQRSGERLLKIDRPQAVDIRNFFISQRRKIPSPQVKIYPVLFNLELYFMAYGDDKQPGSQRLKKVRGSSPATRWRESQGMYYKMCKNKREVRDFVNRLKKRHGFKIVNFREFSEELREIQIIKRKDLKEPKTIKRERRKTF